MENFVDIHDFREFFFELLFHDFDEIFDLSFPFERLFGKLECETDFFGFETVSFCGVLGIISGN